MTRRYHLFDANASCSQPPHVNRAICNIWSWMSWECSDATAGFQPFPDSRCSLRKFLDKRNDKHVFHKENLRIGKAHNSSSRFCSDSEQNLEGLWESQLPVVQAQLKETQMKIHHRNLKNAATVSFHLQVPLLLIKPSEEGSKEPYFVA